MKLLLRKFCLSILFVTCVLILGSCNSSSSNSNSNLQSQYIQIGTQTLHYFQTNNFQNTPIVLLTGVGTTSSFWSKSFIDCLSKSHQVYLLDYPGIQSKVASNGSISVEYFAKIANDFIIAKGIKKPALIGWSMGGSIALQASFLNDNLYQHLYLLSAYVPTGVNISNPFPPHPPFKNDADIMNYVYTNNLYGYTPAQLDFYSNQLISTKIADIFPSSKYTEDEISNMIEWGNTQSIVTNFKQSTVPVTFIIPDNDTIINEAEAKAGISNYTGNKNIISIANSGHDVSLQHPEQVCNNIK